MTGDGVLFERTFWLNRHPLSRLFVALSPRRLIITQNAEECGNIANMAVQDRSNTEYNLQKCDVKKIQNRSNIEHSLQKCDDIANNYLLTLSLMPPTNKPSGWTKM